MRFLVEEGHHVVFMLFDQHVEITGRQVDVAGLKNIPAFAFLDCHRRNVRRVCETCGTAQRTQQLRPIS